MWLCYQIDFCSFVSVCSEFEGLLLNFSFLIGDTFMWFQSRPKIHSEESSFRISSSPLPALRQSPSWWASVTSCWCFVWFYENKQIHMRNLIIPPFFHWEKHPVYTFWPLSFFPKNISMATAIENANSLLFQSHAVSGKDVAIVHWSSLLLTHIVWVISNLSCYRQ